MKSRPAFLLPLLVVAALSGCASHMKPEAWDKLVNDFLDSTFAARPDIAVNAGRHEFDGKLPDWSDEGLEKERGRLEEWRARIDKADTVGLDSTRKFERNYMIAVIDGQLFWLDRADWPHKNPTFYTDALDPDPYVSREYAPLETRIKSYTAYARAVPKAAAQIRANLKAPMPRTFIDRAEGAFGGFASFYHDDVPKVFAPVKDAALQKDFKAANDSAVAAMNDLKAYFESMRTTQTENYAMGADLFKEMLWATERVDTPLDELMKIGQQDLARNLKSLNEACAKYAPGKKITECVAKADANKPKGSPVDEATKQLADLRAFIEKSQVVTIPGPEQARVHESPPYMRWNSAYINIPGPYEKNLPSTYFYSPPDPAWTAAERAQFIPGKADLLFTSVHEVWPGHFLQFLHANRAKSKFGQVFVGYAFAEGWAHYAEEMMWESGLGNGDPETHIGQLTNALLRNVRFLSAIGLHTQGWSVAQSEKMFLEDGHQDVGNARQQAARGTFDPAYLNYTLGKLMIRKLREDWTATRGGRNAWKEFHDKFLDFGGPPIPLVRKAMLPGDSGKLF